MEPRELMYGFSDLKKLLIQTYQIDQPPEVVKLYFSEGDNALVVHDYDDHRKQLFLSLDVFNKLARPELPLKVINLVNESLKQSHPANFLNNEFLLNGFFRY
ncbi:MAG: hypothetical protein H7328_13190 [Bdellovibrio sp.]|nr:hypothetical protein [Bdellovibrio sp.]